MEILFRVHKNDFFSEGFVNFSEAQQQADKIGGKVYAVLVFAA